MVLLGVGSDSTLRCAISSDEPNLDSPGIQRGSVEATDDPMLPLRISMVFEDSGALRELVGELGKHLKVAGKALGVRISQRGNQIDIRGQDRSIELAAQVLGQLYGVAQTGYHLHPVDVDQACRMVSSEPDVKLVDLYRDTITIGAGKSRVHPRSPRQRIYLHAIRDYELVFGIGPAGTGSWPWPWRWPVCF